MSNKELFKALWSWMTEEPSRNKYEFPAFLEMPSHERMSWDRKEYCPACKEAEARGPCSDDPLRSTCPLAKAAVALGYADGHLCLNGLYPEFSTARAEYRRAMAMGENTLPSRAIAVALAKKIRDLEWEDRP